MALIQIQILGPDGNPLEGVTLNATSPTMGPWAGITDCAGNFIPTLAPAHYDIQLSKPGYKTMVWPTDLADCGTIRQAMEYDHIIPDRDAIINVQGNFLNLYDSEDIPIWDIYLTSLLLTGNKAKFNDWISRLRNAGTKHINLAISYNYPESLGWTNSYPIPGQDFYKHGLADFLSCVIEIQNLGFIPIIKLAYDGQDYTSFGWTYGWQYGMDNFEATVLALAELYDTVLWSTGFDGCFPTWTPIQTQQMLQKMRKVLGETGCIDTEFSGPGTVGYCHMGKGPADWVPDSLGILDNFSIEFMTYPPDSTGTQQTLARLLGPAATNIQPGNAGPWYLQQMSSIKKINICAYETVAFQAIRKQITSQDAKNVASSIAHYGATSFGNGLP